MSHFWRHASSFCFYLDLATDMRNNNGSKSCDLKIIQKLKEAIQSKSFQDVRDIILQGAPINYSFEVSNCDFLPQYMTINTKTC